MEPANTPKPVVARMSAELAKALKEPELVKRLEAMGFDLEGSTPEQFEALIDRDISAYAAIAQKANITLDR